MNPDNIIYIYKSSFFKLITTGKIFSYKNPMREVKYIIIYIIIIIIVHNNNNNIWNNEWTKKVFF